MAKIIIIAGYLAVGKSRLAKNLSKHYHIPYYNKERIKEILGNEAEVQTPELSKTLSTVSKEVLLHILDRQVRTGSSVILEANFHQPELERIKQETNFHKVPVYLLHLTGDIDVLYERLLYREHYENRHPIHLTHPLQTIEEFEAYVMKWRSEPEVLPRLTIDVSGKTSDDVYAEAVSVLEAADPDFKTRTNL